MIDPNAALSLLSAIVSGVIGYLSGWRTRIGALAILAALLSAGAAVWALTHPVPPQWVNTHI